MHARHDPRDDARRRERRMRARQAVVWTWFATWAALIVLLAAAQSAPAAERAVVGEGADRAAPAHRPFAGSARASSAHGMPA